MSSSDELELLLLDEFELLLLDEFELLLLELFDDVLFELLEPVLFELLELVPRGGAGAGAGAGTVGGGAGVEGGLVGAIVVGAAVGGAVVGATVVGDTESTRDVDVLIGVSVIGGGASLSSSSARIVPVANAARPSPPIAPARNTHLARRVGFIVHLPSARRLAPSVLIVVTQCRRVDEPSMGGP